MKFLSVYTVPQAALAPPTPEGMAAMGQLVQETIASGEMISTGMFPVSQPAARVRVENGTFTVNDVPVNAQAIRCGWALLNAKSKDDAIRMTKNFLKLAEVGECEVFELKVGAARSHVFGDVDPMPGCAGTAGA